MTTKTEYIGTENEKQDETIQRLGEFIKNQVTEVIGNWKCFTRGGWNGR